MASLPKNCIKRCVPVICVVNITIYNMCLLHPPDNAVAAVLSTLSNRSTLFPPLSVRVIFIWSPAAMLASRYISLAYLSWHTTRVNVAPVEVGNILVQRIKSRGHGLSRASSDLIIYCGTRLHQRRRQGY